MIKKNKITKIYKHKVYDYIIIGSGIAGLYSAYKLLNKNPKLKILILEKNSKKNIGGRIGNILFNDSYVVSGAGIGRENKDTLLKKLLNNLDIKYNTFLSTRHYSNNIIDKCNTKNTFIKLKNIFDKYIKNKKLFNKYIKNKTFKYFGTKILGKKEYNNFITCSGYTDYENADIKDTLYHYNFDDNYSDFTGMAINWNLVKDKLVQFIGSKNIITNCNVEKIKNIKNKNNNYYKILCNENNKNKLFYTNKIIIATTVETVKKLLPKYKIYNNIKPNNFLRLYAKFSNNSINILKKYISGYTIVNTPLQKILPINSDKGIYMISYSDNNKAKYLHKIIFDKLNKNKKYINSDTINIIKNKFLNNYFEKLLKKSLNIDKNENIKINKLMEIYWNIGTHYYSPIDHNKYKNRKQFIKKIQYPEKNIYVVGEMVALDQGWVEGTLSSVELLNIFN